MAGRNRFVQKEMEQFTRSILFQVLDEQSRARATAVQAAAHHELQSRTLSPLPELHVPDAWL